jgi:orotidine-5'-phosphate decarboxylase
MLHVADRLHTAIDRSGSIACVGLDPRPALLPPSIRERKLATFGPTAQAVASAFVTFNIGIIDAVAGHCAAVKPQTACYEAYGSDGWAALAETVRYATEAGLVVIADAKRGDIGSTASHYRDAFLGEAPGLDGEPVAGLGADWLTVNPYLGSDNVTEFLDQVPGGSGVFVLAKTSNPSSGELQDRECEGETVAEVVARLIHRWGADRQGEHGLSDVGAVVGATYPDEARLMRSIMPDSPFLVPGYGAQGGSAADAVAGARPSDGGGLVVNSSRGIIGAWREAGDDDWAGAARHALDEMNADLDAARA